MMSIRAKLLLLLISVMVLTLFLALVEGYQRSLARAETLFDSHLHTQAEVLFHSGEIAPQSLPNVIWQRWHQGDIVAGSTTWLTQPEQSGMSTLNAQGQRLRVATYCQNQQCVAVAEPIAERFALSEQLIMAMVVPMLWGMALLALLISIVVKRALRPLSQLSQELKGRAAHDFTLLQMQPNESEIKPVVQTLNELLHRTEQAYLRERYFASDAAHELRTPLSAMKINLHNLQQRYDDDDAQALVESVERLNHLVEQMLALGRTSSHQWQDKLGPQSLAQLCQVCIAELYPQIEKKQLDISLNGECRDIQGETFTLSVMIKNIISNAVKYTPEGGKVVIELQDLGAEVILSVSDSGPGIATDLRERIFDRFFRVGGDSHPSHIPGAGLGLAIVQHVVGLYQGKLALMSSPWGGLQVQVTLARQRDTLCSD
ncbi:ATP-binding protein [Pseudoalteromonas sp. CNC9-20]|uniref:ATP-binding protein n=1 Tax=Pseudoalteromonas sp. CNC9-20 TaxID=2917750 RepID=UPI001EF54101|nr:ATP-binding protein [Pseudoalteromonas sp. CNC9-20]MCG7569024.1 ATP-binding protein [Pseudoalteromonas sp. CNC9-20]